MIALDTEFPGFLCEVPPSVPATVQYQALRKNVDLLQPIQLGIAVASADGSLLGAWNFNLWFDHTIHLFNESSL